MVLLRECWWWCSSMCRCSCWGNAEDGAVLCADRVAKKMLMLMQFNVQIGLLIMMQFYVQMGMLRQHWWWCVFMWRCTCWDNADDDAVLCLDGYVGTALMMMHFYVKMQLLRQCWWWRSSMCRWVCWDSADDDALLCEDAAAETMLMMIQGYLKMQLLRQCWCEDMFAERMLMTIACD